MKTDDRLSRRPPKRTNGDAIFAVPCGCGQNIHEILAHIMGLWAFFLSAFTAVIEAVMVGFRRRNLQSGQPEVCSR